jgi:hypothetical protein
MSSLRDHIERTLPESDHGLAVEAEVAATTGAITLPQQR